MKRLIGIAVVLLAAAAIVVVGTGADDGSGYEVRAIFDNAVSVIPGEDVKIAGVKVGTITDLDVTVDQKAAIVLRIDEPGFAPFRRDARCIIRPQGLIGEKFVECTPTQPRPAGAEAPPPLRTIERGPGKGQHFLPVGNTAANVDPDLVNSIFRRPYAERLSIILNELGTGLAGRGPELRRVIQRADPALYETDKVLAILAKQNKVLADLARDSDIVLAPLAANKRHVAGFIDSAGRTAEATAEQRANLEASLQKLPAFLRALTPTLTDLGALSDQATPVFRDLGDVAPDVNRLTIQLGPLAKAGIPAAQTLGDAAKIGTTALPPIRPVLGQITTFAKAAQPVADNLQATLESLNESGGIERLMDFIFYGVSSTNGFDQLGHYLRAGLQVNQCSQYSITPVTGCTANFDNASASRASAAARRAATDPPGADHSAPRAKPAKTRASSGDAAAYLVPGVPSAEKQAAAQARRQVRRAPSATAPEDPRAGLLDYLFGGDE